MYIAVSRLTTSRLSFVLGLVFPGITAGAAFLEKAGGARSAALGGAYTALADDSEGIFWNPAGMVRVNADEMQFSHAEPLTGLESVRLGANSLSYVHPLKKTGALGAALTDFSVSGVYRENRFLGSYARSLEGLLPGGARGGAERLPALSGGMNAVYLTRSFTSDSNGDPVFSGGRRKSAFTLDAGLLARWDMFSIGVSALNVTEPDLGFQSADRVPLETRVGTAWRREFLTMDAVLAADVSFRRSEADFHLGLETLFLRRSVAFRTGWDGGEWAVGFGYRSPAPSGWGVGIDYAYGVPLRLADEGSGTHRVTVLARFGRSPKKNL
jgi:hypothetical protein